MPHLPIEGDASLVDEQQPSAGGVHSPHTIELDCPPGGIRPWDLIGGVLAGTGLEVPKKHSGPFFGWMEWAFPQVSCERWAEIQEVTRPRIQELYAVGAIRFGSW